MFIASLIPYLLLVSLSVFPYGSSFSGISHIYPHTFLHSLLLIATSSFLLPTLLSFISLYILLLVHYSITRLSLPSTPHPLAYTPFSPLIPNPLLLAIYLLLIILPLLSSFLLLL